MIFSTAETFSSKQPRKGNPKHNDDPEITNKMMKEVYPLLCSGGSEYETKRRAMTRLRVLGRRYQVLADKFGKNIICFLQPYSLTGEPNKEISEKMYVSCENTIKRKELTIKGFTNSMMSISNNSQILETSQGQALRKLCEAADSVVEYLIHGDPPQPQRIRLQTTIMADILAIPKGSPDLLVLLKPEGAAPDTDIETAESA
jgi:hypothetical protein